MPLPGTGRTVTETPQQKNAEPVKVARYNTVGVSVGSAFSIPWLVTTVHGTFSPLNNLFLELGFDLGLVSGAPDVSYYSLYPYAHAAFYRPVTDKLGVYIGAGGGYMMAKYTFKVEGELVKNGFVADAIAGINLFDMVDISYTLRTNFTGADNKVAVGYVYRFK